MSGTAQSTWSDGARRRRLALVGLGLMVLALGAGALWLALREPTLPDGVRIDGVEVGGLTAAEAREALADRADERLGAPVTVRAGNARAVMSPRLLEGTAEVDEAVDEAFAATGRSLLPRSWADTDAGPALELRVSVDHDRVRRAVDRLAVRAETAAIPAGLSAAYGPDGELRTDVRRHRHGRVLDDREALTQELAGALASPDEREVDAALRTVTAQPATAAAQRAERALHRVDGDVLDAEVRVEAEGADVSSSVSRRAAGARLGEVDALASAAVRAADEASARSHPARPTAEARVRRAVAERADLATQDEALAGQAEEVAAALSRQPRNAQLSYDGGSLQITGGETGTQVEAEAVASALREALADTETTTVSVAAESWQPARTRDFYDHVLVLDQGAREVVLYRGGEPVDRWPVAVGQAGSPTPTGEFRIGNKRANPTWVNPDPDGWGEDMPERTGPGDPENPLGVRALDWHRIGGGDTLIRFHGTNAPGSIGDAASRGCVRMLNDDVRELYDRTPLGTAVLSVS